MKMHASLLSALLPTLLAVGAAAQDPAQDPAQDSPTGDSKPFVLEAGETSIENLIDASAKYLDCNILAANTEIGGASPVRLQKAIHTDRDGCLELLASMLIRNQLALTMLDPKLGIMEVLKMDGRRGREVFQRAQWKKPEEILKKPRLKMPVTTVVSLEHINAQLANNALRPFFASSSGSTMQLMIGNIGNQSSLVIAGMQDQVAQAIELVKHCDVEQPPAPFRGQDLPGYVAKLELRLERLEKRIDAMLKKNNRSR